MGRGSGAAQVYAWGGNSFGQLGLGDGLDQQHSPQRVNVLDSRRVSTIACGAYHTLALAADGSVIVFGLNTKGQLGVYDWDIRTNADGFKLPATIPARAMDGPVVSIAAGEEHSIAMTAGGSVYTWGSNEHGQLGRPLLSGSTYDNVPRRLESIPSSLSELHQLAAVAAGYQVSFALTSDAWTYAPSANRTLTPTVGPTRSPTSKPPRTRIPTRAPSAPASRAPASKSPTSRTPTAHPTTDVPTTQPTGTPLARPTRVPSIGRTVAPVPVSTVTSAMPSSGSAAPVALSQPPVESVRPGAVVAVVAVILASALLLATLVRHRRHLLVRAAPLCRVSVWPEPCV